MRQASRTSVKRRHRTDVDRNLQPDVKGMTTEHLKAELRQKTKDMARKDQVITEWARRGQAVGLCKSWCEAAGWNDEG
jgi:hypothetical protein